MRTGALLVLTAIAAACAPPGRVPLEAPAAARLPQTTSARETVAPRTAAGFACEPQPRVDAWEHRLRSQRELLEATEQGLARGAAYLPALRRIMEDAGVPSSLALLPVVESGFWPDARGRLGERGLWQLSGSTARRFGLVVDRRRDDRLHPDRSTAAAARYLHYLHRRYGEWPLAIAAYNAGERRIDRALAREPGSTFWELAELGYLPHASRDYVSRFLAVVRLSNSADC